LAYLINGLSELHRIYNFGALNDKDDAILKSQGRGQSQCHDHSVYTTSYKNVCEIKLGTKIN